MPFPIAWERECLSFPLLVSGDCMFSLVCGCLRLPHSPHGLLCVRVFRKDTVIGIRAFSTPELSHLELSNLIPSAKGQQWPPCHKKHRDYSVLILPDSTSICHGWPLSWDSDSPSLSLIASLLSLFRFLFPFLPLDADIRRTLCKAVHSLPHQA